MAVSGAGALLGRSATFSTMASSALGRLDEVAFVRRIARGQILFVSGEPADHLYLVRSGSLKIHVTSPDGGDLLLSLLGPGAVIGDVSVVDGGSRSAGATALTACELLAVPAAVIRELLREEPDALWAVAGQLAASVRRLTERSADLIFLDLPRRLAKLMLDSAIDGVVDLPVTQSDLAAMLGVSRQALNKSLSSLVARGWLEPRDGSVEIVDHAALERLVYR